MEPHGQSPWSLHKNTLLRQASEVFAIAKSAEAVQHIDIECSARLRIHPRQGLVFSA